MKRNVITAVLIILLATLAGCGASAAPLDPHEPLIIENMATLQIQEIESLFDMEAPITSRTVRYSMGGVYYDIKTAITNTSGQDIKLEDAFSFKIDFKNKYTSTQMKVESPDRTQLLDTYTLKPEETVLLHIYTHYNTAEINIYNGADFSITVNEKGYTFAIDSPNDFRAEQNFINLGDTLSGSNDISIDIQECYIDKQLLPSAGGSSGYEPSSSQQSFMILKLSVTNHSSTQIPADSIISFRPDKPDHLITSTSGFVALESEDGKKLSTSGVLQPGETRILYCVDSVMDDSLEETTQLRLDTIDGTYYINRLE